MEDELRERIAQALYVEHSRRYGVALARWSESHPSYYADADAVIAALGLREVSGPQYACDRLYGGCPARQVTGRCEHVEYVRKYVLETPWERIEGDG